MKKAQWLPKTTREAEVTDEGGKKTYTAYSIKHKGKLEKKRLERTDQQVSTNAFCSATRVYSCPYLE